MPTPLDRYKTLVDGLVGIRERMLHLGGQLNLISELAEGTRLSVTIPAHQ